MPRQLEDVLITRGIRHRIVLDETTHEDDIARPPACGRRLARNSQGKDRAAKDTLSRKAAQ